MFKLKLKCGGIAIEDDEKKRKNLDDKLFEFELLMLEK